MSHIVIRPAAPDDAPAWIAMRRSLWPDDPGDSHSSEVREYFGGTLRNPAEVLLAFDENGAALGFAELSIRNYAEDAETDRVAYLEGWYVAPQARRQGVGRALIDAAETWALKQGCVEFGSDALIDNEVSARAHRALGFAETGQIRCFLKRIG